MKGLHIVTFTLVIIGAINWGLVGLFNFNLVTALFGAIAGIEKIIYVLVGISGVYVIATHKNDCKICAGK